MFALGLSFIMDLLMGVSGTLDSTDRTVFELFFDGFIQYSNLAYV